MAETFGQIFDQHTDDIIATTELLKELADREGQYVWKQLTAQNGDFVAFVTADDEGSYPNGGTQDGYWYERVTSYTGANPITIDESGTTIPANTLLDEVLQIISGVEAGVSGIDYGFVTLEAVSGSGSSAQGPTSITIEHNLKNTPRYVMLVPFEVTTNIGGTSPVYFHTYYRRTDAPMASFNLIINTTNYYGATIYSAISYQLETTDAISISGNQVTFTALNSNGTLPVGKMLWVVVE